MAAAPLFSVKRRRRGITRYAQRHYAEPLVASLAEVVFVQLFGSALDCVFARCLPQPRSIADLKAALAQAMNEKSLRSNIRSA